jgi:hypothetical protein
MYVTYITFYSGNKLPPYYIGYTTNKNIEKGYGGSVSSKKYKEIWKEERTNNPHLFKTKVIKSWETKKEALSHEEKIHSILKVNENDLYINQCIANQKWTLPTNRKLSDEHKRKIGKSSGESRKGIVFDINHKISLSNSQKNRWKKYHEDHPKKEKIKKSRKKGSDHHRYGKTLDDSARKNISDKLKGNNCRSKRYLIDEKEIFNLKRYCLLVEWPYKYILGMLKRKGGSFVYNNIGIQEMKKIMI